MPSCTDKSPGDQVVDPLDCKKYYVCLNDDKITDTSIPCGNGQVFKEEEEDGKCVNGTECTNKCDTSGEPGSPEFCQMECSESQKYINDKKDCNKFYACLPGGNLYPLTCKGGKELYFDSTEQKCTADQTKCCDYCQKTCKEEFTEIADPYDCRSYYICMKKGEPEEIYHQTCAEGKVFDRESSSCIDGDTCENLCEAEPVTPKS